MHGNSGDDPEISAWMARMVQKTKDEIEDVDYDDTTSEARKLLESWSIQTESFCPEPSSTRTKVPTKPKMAVYRKLDTPMMVAKKIETDRPSVDPTLIMEARRKHILEMKAQRLERQAAKQMQIPTKKAPPKVGLPPKVSLPDIDGDIKSYKERIAQKTAEKIKELEEKNRQSIQIRAIEESAQQSIAKEEKKQIKKQKKLEKKSKEINEEAMKQQLQLLYKTLRLRLIRRYYTLWSSRCSYHSQNYKRAAAFNNFQKMTQCFSFWRSRYYRRKHERELDELESRLRKDKQMEEAAINFYVRHQMQKSFVRWTSRYKAQIEMKIIEEQHKKRRALLINKIEEKQQQIQNQTEENQTNSEKSSVSSSPPRKSMIPKSKPKPLKVDPRIEAMEKRAEEQRKKKLEKAAREAQLAEKEEEEKAKLQIEEQRKKKLEHMQFLEKEKKKREEQQKMQEEFEKALQRKKYIQTASKEFRLRRIVYNQFKCWEKILNIRIQLEEKSERFREDKLLSYGLLAFRMNQKDNEDERTAKAQEFYAENITRKAFLGWLYLRNVTATKFFNCQKMHNKYLLHSTLHAIIVEKRKRQKAKFMAAVQQMNRSIMRRCFRAWPEGCAAVRDDERRAKDREDLMAKALQMFDELSDDDF